VVANHFSRFAAKSSRFFSLFPVKFSIEQLAEFLARF